MSRTIAFISLLLMACPISTFAQAFGEPSATRPVGVPGQISARLEAVLSDEPEHLPFRPASLTIENRSPRAISSIALRNSAGGMIIRQDVTIPSQTSETMTVYLPSTSVLQTYIVRTGDRGEIGEFPAEIRWPEEIVEAARNAFINADAYDRYETQSTQSPAWPEGVKTYAFLGAALFALAAGGTLLIRRRQARIFALAALVFAGVGVSVWAICRPLDSQAHRLIERKGVIALQSMRTGSYGIPQQGLYPIYRNDREMVRDTLVLDPGGQMTVQTEGKELRLFGRQGPVKKASSTATQRVGPSGSASGPSPSSGPSLSTSPSS